MNIKNEIDKLKKSIKKISNKTVFIIVRSEDELQNALNNNAKNVDLVVLKLYV